MITFFKHSGSENAAIDASSSTTRFSIAPSGSQGIEIYQIAIHIQSADSAANEYGGLTLTNGLELAMERVKTGSHEDISKLFGANNIMNIADLSMVGELQNLVDPTDNTVKATTCFIRLDVPILLSAREHERLSFVLRDNFSTLTKHKFWAHTRPLVYS